MADEKKVSGKTRAGGAAKPFPWEEAIAEQYERSKSRLKGLATEPEAELQRILEQYLPKKSDSREERLQKLEDLAMGFAGTTKLPTPKLARASEVFGPHEGKTAMFTETDRTKVGGGFLGGPGFSSLQLELPAYEGKTWGVASMPKAQTIIRSNQRVPEGQAIWSTYIGHPEQHRSNQMVFDQIFNQFRREAKKGNLPNELRESINERLATQLDANNNPLFPPDVDIMAKNFRQLANTFDRRAAAAEIMGGKGVGGKKGSIVDYPKLIESTTDPALIGAPTWAVGPRVFTLTGDVGVHPELHPAFPYLLHGEDLGKAFNPVPHELAMKDFIEKVRREKGRKMGYMDLARGYAPQQFISEEWLTALQKAGYAEGGLAQYGLRHSGEGVKGKGYFGPMAGRDGTVTELSAEDESGEYPLVVPTLTAEELDRLLAGGEPTPGMLDKASSWAATRRKRGESPFASPTELRMPRPKAEGGSVSLTDLPDEVNPSNWREHLQNNVLADARALLGAKDGGVINLDELIEKSLKKKDGGVINLDELIAWTLAKDEHRKMKEGGAVKMADGGQTFPLQRPEEVTDLKPRPRTKRDELLEMLSKGVGSVHEFMAKPFGYENPPGEMVSSLIGLPGTAKTLERMAYGDPLTSGAGMTTNLLPETTEAAFLGLGAAPTALKMTKNLPVGMSIKPTTTDLLDLELASKMKASPTAVVPEAKAGKVKAPANPVGFYNPAEKAALNLQRKKGSGSAFISDLKKQPGVTDERIAELGLTDLASNPNVTREDVIAAVEQNRIPLRESVRRPYDEAAEYSDTISGIEDSLIYYRGGVKDVQAELERVRKMAPNSPLVKQYEDKLAVMRDKVDELEAKLDSTKPAKFGPDVDESYSLPGGEDYREIRVRLPERKSELPNLEGFTVETIRENKYTGQRDILIRNPQGNIVTNRYGFRGDDAQALQDEAESLARDATKKDNFYHTTHHDNEPNVLFHLRVANHVDEEGKRGLLIDELQSDWHQKGREKGYKTPQIEARRKELGQLAWPYMERGQPIPAELRAEIEALPDLSGVPDAPFKDNWYQLGLKRAIKEAADTGMDRVYLTTGARQADRYDLSKQIDSLVLDKSGDGYLLTANREGSPVLNEQFTDPQKLESLIGKEASKKLLEKVNAAEDRGGVRTAKLAGVDLKVGGEGMKQYYDKNYKNYLEKYAKQHGGKLGMTHLKTREEWPFPITIKEEGGQFRLFGRDPRTDSFNPNLAGRSFDSYDDALKARDTLYEGFAEPVYYIDLTDAMRESAKKGQSYADGGGVFNTDPDITDAGRIIPEHTI